MKDSWHHFSKQLSWLVIGGLLLCGAALAVICIALRLQGFELLTVQSNSMVPTFQKGDALIVNANNAPIKVGDVISYHSKLDSSVTISHRLRGAQAGKYQTQGDALDQYDPIITSDQVIGKAVAILPHFGTVLGIFRSKVGLTVFVYIPALLALIAEANRLVSVQTTKRYRLYAWRTLGPREYN